MVSTLDCKNEMGYKHCVVLSDSFITFSLMICFDSVSVNAYSLLIRFLQ